VQNAQLFDGVDTDGNPYFVSEHPKLDDPELRTNVIAFLSGGSVIRRTTIRDIDRIDNSRGRAVPMVTHTDGEWIWSSAMRYYVEQHRIAPAQDFLEYMISKKFEARIADEGEIRAALDILHRKAQP
jgi:hypothetical protein